MVTQRKREIVSVLPDSEYFKARIEEGWTLAALEWEREVEAVERSTPREEVPFGSRVADDCMHLEENPAETQTLAAMLELIVNDELPLSQVTDELNRRGFRNRGGSKWTQTAIFNMLPRLIEMAPQLYSTDEWAHRRRRLVDVRP